MDTLASLNAAAEESPARSAPSRSRLVHPVLLGMAALVLVAVSAAGAWFLRERWSRPASSEEVGPSSSQTADAAVKRGRLLYQVNCQACHGPDGHGDGSAAAEMKPPLPRDFTAAPWKFGATPEAIRQVLRDGSPGTSMPGFALLPEADRDALAAFVLTLAPPEAREIPALPAETADRLRRLGFIPEERPPFAPELTLRDLDGRDFSLQQRRGNVVLLNFWGTSCVNCLNELPELEKLSHEIGQGVAVVSVCFDETDTTEVRRLVDTRVRDLPVYVNPDGLSRSRYDVQVMPSLYLIDPAGRLVGHAIGARSWSIAEMRDLVRTLKE